LPVFHIQKHLKVKKLTEQLVMFVKLNKIKIFFLLTGILCSETQKIPKKKEENEQLEMFVK
jgi:hypothetical protein